MIDNKIFMPPKKKRNSNIKNTNTNRIGNGSGAAFGSGAGTASGSGAASGSGTGTASGSGAASGTASGSGAASENIGSNLNTNIVKPIKSVLKIFPYVGKSNNRKGYYIGDIKVGIEADEMPFNYADEVDYTLSNLYKYARFRKNAKDFFVNYPQTIEIMPNIIDKNKFENLKLGGNKKKHRNTIKNHKNHKKDKKPRTMKNKRKSYKKIQ
jgi:hypothetical protein